jgi:Ca-activated chloride channel homolog
MACVLDISGSMSGDKLKFAKRAVCKVIKHLSPQDTFHFVTYSTHVNVVFQNGNLSDKPTLKAGVRQLNAVGSTNICDALTIATGLINSTPIPENALKRLFLFSDGDANAGSITNAEGLSQLAKSLHENSGVTISTFGLGRDYNEAVMSGIAKASSGDYFFIESAQAIPVTMSKSVHGMLNVYGTNASLTVSFYLFFRFQMFLRHFGLFVMI